MKEKEERGASSIAALWGVKVLKKEEGRRRRKKEEGFINWSLQNWFFNIFGPCNYENLFYLMFFI
ncbi:hypothetical protein HanRHA438_Chr16g0744921 [Helianthus annuus]|nr:hypothetical protein HanRHA438_Chr16g0744921 [Helianthus annuus]